MEWSVEKAAQAKFNRHIWNTLWASVPRFCSHYFPNLLAELQWKDEILLCSSGTSSPYVSWVAQRMSDSNPSRRVMDSHQLKLLPWLWAFPAVSLGHRRFSCQRLATACMCDIKTLPFWTMCRCPAGSGETPTLDTVDSYMKKLHSLIISNPQEHESLINTVRDVVNRLDRWEFSLFLLLFGGGFVLSDESFPPFPPDNWSNAVAAAGGASQWMLLSDFCWSVISVISNNIFLPLRGHRWRSCSTFKIYLLLFTSL